MLNLARKIPLPLIFIVLLALVLRFVSLNAFPPSLNWDEVSHGYNAFSILKTGADEWGVRYPLIFRAYGDYKLPVYIYVSAIFEAVLGINSWALRLPSALSGVLLVIGTYLLSGKLFDKKVGLLSALLVAVEPWSFFLSRGAFEANMGVTLSVFGIYFFLKGTERPKFMFLSAILLGLSLWTYNSFRVFIPLVFVALIVIYRKLSPAFLIIFLLFVIPMFVQVANPSGQARLTKVTILDDGAVAQIIERRNTTALPPQIARLVYNRPNYFIYTFVKNWVKSYSPDFLFIHGGSQYQFNIPNRGVLYIINLPFILIGLLYIARGIKNKGNLMLLVWLILAPAAGSATRESPHTLRLVTMLPLPMIITSVGLVGIFNAIKFKKILLVGYLLILFLSAENYLLDYFGSYSKTYSWSWQYGHRELTVFVEKNYAKYDKIIITKKYGEPHEFLLFYTSWDPVKYLHDPNLNRFYQSGWYWVDGFGKFYFINDWQIPKTGEVFVQESKRHVTCAKIKCLLATGPDNFPVGWREIDQIKFLDGKIAFRIFEN